MPTTHALIGVDIGATTMAAGLVTPTGEILHAIQQPTHRDGPGTALTALRRLVRELAAHARTRQLSLDGVGIGVAGVVDTAKGAMLPHPHNGLPELGHVPLVDEIRSVVDVPVYVDNDANALALAEWTFGLGRGAHSLVLIAIGTSVGAGLVFDDTLFRGASGWAGELHGIPVNFAGRPCFCGARGCLGAYVEGRAIRGEARARLAAGAVSALSGLTGGDDARITAELVFAAAAAGDPVATSIVDEACVALGAGIAFIVNALNPEVIVVTGGVARSLAPLAAQVQRTVATYTQGSDALAATKIHVIGGDKDYTVRGGAALVLYEAGRQRAAE